MLPAVSWAHFSNARSGATPVCFDSTFEIGCGYTCGGDEGHPPLGEFYRTEYDANPNVFQYDDSGFYPTHWISRYLGNVLPSSIRCVYIGSICDVPAPGFANGVFHSKALQTAAATMTDPRTYALWTAGSALEGIVGGYAVGGEVFDASIDATVNGLVSLEDAGIPAFWLLYKYSTGPTLDDVYGWEDQVGKYPQ